MSVLLRLILLCAGAFIVYTGVDTGLGGILTLGLQGVEPFVEITSEEDFLIQDNHIRFMGGVWLGIGLLFLISAIKPSSFRGPLLLSFFLIFVGGLMRVASQQWDVVFGPDIAFSLAAELVLMPILAIWVGRLGPTAQS